MQLCLKWRMQEHNFSLRAKTLSTLQMILKACRAEPEEYIIACLLTYESKAISMSTAKNMLIIEDVNDNVIVYHFSTF